MECHDWTHMVLGLCKTYFIFIWAPQTEFPLYDPTKTDFPHICTLRTEFPLMCYVKTDFYFLRVKSVMPWVCSAISNYFLEDITYFIRYQYVKVHLEIKIRLYIVITTESQYNSHKCPPNNKTIRFSFLTHDWKSF